MVGNLAASPEDLRRYDDDALQSCLVVEHERPGVILARGGTVLDFLQRMSTNDLQGLEPGASRGTVLTTAIGRIVDVLRVVNLADRFLLVTSPGMSDQVRAWLARYILFNDDVVLEEPSSEYHLWGLYGPSAQSSLEALDHSGESAGQAVHTWNNETSLRGIRMLVGSAPDRQARLLWGERGPGSPAHAAYEALRIEHGIPATGHELSGDVLPLEVNLWHLVSFRKGCYIGQEIIARMESRQQVARGVCMARLEQAVEVPQEVAIDGQVVGRLTSAAVSPRLGPIGLALTRTAALADGERAAILSPAGVAARLEPFPV